MRILPVAMRFADAGPDIVASLAMRWSAITHRHPRSQLACAYLSLLVVELMHGASPEEGHRQTAATFDKTLASFPSERSHFLRLLAEDFGLSRRPDIRSGGYVIDTLEAALWCLLQGGSYSDIVLRAVNLGGDTDTTGCVAGGLAGVWLGVDSIPAGWKDALAKDPPLDGLIERFVAAAAVA